MGLLPIKPGTPRPLASSHDGLVRRCAQELGRRGIPWQPLLRAHNINISGPALPGARVPASSEQAILRDAERLAGDPFLGWSLGAIELRDLGLFGYSVLNAADVRNALDTLIEISALVSESLQLVLHVDDGEATLAQTLPMHGAINQAMLSVLLCHLRELVGPELQLLRAGLCEGDKARLRGLAERAGVPVEGINEPILYASFPARLLDRPIRGADAHLARTLRPLWEAERARLAARHLELLQLQDAIVPLLPQGKPTAERVAEALAISTPALREKLKISGTKLPHVVDWIRAGLANTVLSEPDMTTTRAARALGFGDTGAFTRAYRRWWGVSPSGSGATNLGLLGG